MVHKSVTPRSCDLHPTTFGFKLRLEPVGGVRSSPAHEIITVLRNSPLSCTICEERKEKRFCPAVHGKICPHCCGEQREVTLDCPSDCPYLQQARAHAKEQAEPGAHISREALFPEVEIAQQFLYEREELIMGLSFALAKSARSDRSLLDRDLIAALSSLAKTYETLVNSNLIYEEPTANATRHSIVREIETMIREFRAAEQQHIGHTRLRDSDVLKALVFIIRMGLARTSGRPKSRAFTDFLYAQFPEKQSSLVGPEETGNRIVIP